MPTPHPKPTSSPAAQQPSAPRTIDTTERLDPLIAESLRRMTPDERLAEALRLHRWGQQLAEAGVRGQHPDWSEKEINNEVLRRMLGGAARAITLRSDCA